MNDWPETGLGYALQEVEHAIADLEAALKRLNEATANLAAAQVIHNAKQGENDGM
jgi:uncharacterized protein YoxC